MSDRPEIIERFLKGERLAVAGVSRKSSQPANAIFRRLRESGHDVYALNPHADQVEGAACYRNLDSVPEPVDGVVVATPPEVSADVVQDCAEHGVDQIWFHRSFGRGSVSESALWECEKRGIEPIVGGCPLMYCGSVDVVHRCMRWWLRWRGRIPS